jgi:hypothetical protein
VLQVLENHRKAIKTLSGEVIDSHPDLFLSFAIIEQQFNLIQQRIAQQTSSAVSSSSPAIVQSVSSLRLHPSVSPTSSSQTVTNQLKVSSPTVFIRPTSYQSSPQPAVSSSTVSQIDIEEILPPPKAFARKGGKIFKLANYGGMTSNEMIEQMKQAKLQAEAVEESKQLKKQQREEKTRLADEEKARKQKLAAEKKKSREELDQQKALKRKIKQEPLDDPEEEKKRIPVKKTATIVVKQSLDDPEEEKKRIPVKRTATIVPKQSLDDPEGKKKRISVKKTATIVPKQSIINPASKNKRKCVK